jgi:hypothetical protein
MSGGPTPFKLLILHSFSTFIEEFVKNFPQCF